MSIIFQEWKTTTTNAIQLATIKQINTILYTDDPLSGWTAVTNIITQKPEMKFSATITESMRTLDNSEKVSEFLHLGHSTFFHVTKGIWMQSYSMTVKQDSFKHRNVIRIRSKLI